MPRMGTIKLLVYTVVITSIFNVLLHFFSAKIKTRHTDTVVLHVFFSCVYVNAFNMFDLTNAGV